MQTPRDDSRAGPPGGGEATARRRLTATDLIQQVIAEDCPELAGMAGVLAALAQQAGSGRPGRIRDAIKSVTNA